MIPGAPPNPSPLSIKIPVLNTPPPLTKETNLPNIPNSPIERFKQFPEVYRSYLNQELEFTRTKLKEFETPIYRKNSGYTQEQIQEQIKHYTVIFRGLLAQRQTTPATPSPKWETVQLDPLYH